MDSRRVSFAGPQMSTVPPPGRVRRASPEWTVRTVPLEMKKLVPPGTAPPRVLPSKEMSSPVNLATAPMGQCSCAAAGAAWIERIAIIATEKRNARLARRRLLPKIGRKFRVSEPLCIEEL